MGCLLLRLESRALDKTTTLDEIPGVIPAAISHYFVEAVKCVGPGLIAVDPMIGPGLLGHRLEKTMNYVKHFRVNKWRLTLMLRVGSLYAAGLVACLSLCLANLRAQEAIPTPAIALQHLKDGNDRFAADRLEKKDVSSTRRKQLAKGQRPLAVVLTCADSRVSPELIFDQGLGDLFVVRVAGNVTDPALIGSIEYALAELKTPLVLVLGHEECGAVKAALAKTPLSGNLRALVETVHVGKAREADGRIPLPDATLANVAYHAAELSRKSPVIKEFVEGERVRVAAGIYSLSTGKVQWLDWSDKTERRQPQRRSSP